MRKKPFHWDLCVNSELSQGLAVGEGRCGGPSAVVTASSVPEPVTGIRRRSSGESPLWWMAARSEPRTEEAPSPGQAHAGRACLPPSPPRHPLSREGGAQPDPRGDVGGHCPPALISSLYEENDARFRFPTRPSVRLPARRLHLPGGLRPARLQHTLHPLPGWQRPARALPPPFTGRTGQRLGSSSGAPAQSRRAAGGWQMEFCFYTVVTQTHSLIDHTLEV